MDDQAAQALILNVEGQTGGEQDISDEKISGIVQEIMADTLKKERQNQVYVGKHLDDDWDEELYISDLYEQMLQAVQQGAQLKHRNGERLDVKTLTFDKYLELCMETLDIRREELKLELARGDINQRIYNNGKMLADMAEQAIRKYQEKNETARLIGV